jgi:putative hydrolase of the HAD superfamily
MRFAELDAVTVDGYGTLVRLIDPAPLLERTLADRGIVRSPDAIRAAFAAEVAHYRPRATLGRDPESLAALRLDCTRVFLEAAEADLDPATFVDTFLSSLVFEPEPGALEAVAALRSRGIDCAVVSHWDIGLHAHLQRLGVDTLFSAVVTTAEAGAPKPDPAVFRLALARLGVEPDRALHVGDEVVDAEGAAAAGMRFAPAPLATVFEGWT